MMARSSGLMVLWMSGGGQALVSSQHSIEIFKLQITIHQMSAVLVSTTEYSFSHTPKNKNVHKVQPTLIRPQITLVHTFRIQHTRNVEMLLGNIKGQIQVVEVVTLLQAVVVNELWAMAVDESTESQTILEAV